MPAPYPARRSSDQSTWSFAGLRTPTGLAWLGAVALVLASGVAWLYVSRVDANDASPSWSPDSHSLVITHGTGAAVDLAIVDLEAGREQPFVMRGDDDSPSFSPDGTRILFSSSRDGNNDIYEMTLTDTNVRRLTTHQARDLWPAFSPDGRQVAFVSDREGAGKVSAYVMNTDGSGVRRLAAASPDAAPQFSPDGRSLAVDAGPDISVVDVATGVARRLTVDSLNGRHPTWAPDGLRLAFVTSRSGRMELFTMDADGSNQRLLVTMAQGNVSDPRWSPDGSHIAFIRLDRDWGIETAGRRGGVLYTLELASGKVNRISR